MAKRKRKPGSGPSLKLMKTYEEPEFIPYIHHTEAGIIEVWQEFPTLTDGDVRKALRGLIKSIQKWDQPLDQPAQLVEEDPVILGIVNEDKIDMLTVAIMEGMQDAFDVAEPLTVEDLLGVLKRINHSIGNMNTGMRQQSYLQFINGMQNQISGRDPDFMDRVVKRIGRMARG